MRKFLLYTVFAFSALIMLGSCGKSGDTIAKVHIVDGTGTPVAGALVTLISYDSQGNNTGVIDREATTDATGTATFNFNDLYKRGQAGFAVLTIEASKDALVGDGIIKVEEETTSETTVTIQ
jgi:hypothetical protein